ncbi:MAG: substrate-binding domain-containing protein [Eubacteriales bacterium]
MILKNKRQYIFRIALKIFVVMCLCSSVFLTACSTRDEGVGILLGLTQPNLSDNLQLSIKTDIQNRCASYDNVRCISYDAGFNYLNQSDDINRLLKLGVDALIVVTVEPELITEAITKAYETGIPVIIIGYAPESGNYSVRIYSDNIKIGQKVGEYVVQLAGKADCTVLQILGDPESRTSKDLKQGFKQAVESHGNIQNEYVMTGYWSQDKTIERLKESDFNDKTPPIDLIFAQNDSMAVGAALGTADFKRDIKIIGIGGYPYKNSDLEALKSGQIDATIALPTGGEAAVDAALKLINGDTVPDQIELESNLIS